MKKIIFILSFLTYITSLNANANDDVFEIIIVTGQRIEAPRYPSFVFNHIRAWEGLGGSHEFLDDYYEQLDEFCDELDDKRPQGCDKRVKPQIVADGCSVPIALQPLYRGSMEQFRNSCNTHDYCYSDLSQGKNDCDTAFRNNMYDQCNMDYFDHGDPFQLSSCRNSASEFYIALRLPLVRQISQGRFESAQNTGACVVWHEDKYDSEC